MRGIVGIRIMFAFSVLSVVPLSLSATPSRAQAAEKSNLVQDFNHYMDSCHPLNSPPVSSPQDCSNELAELTARQHTLNMSDADLKAAGVRGGFH
jgi:hypothetical protein